MKIRNKFLAFIAFFISFGMLVGCKGADYVPYYSVVYEYGGETEAEWIIIDGQHHSAEFVKPGELATPPDIHREGYSQPTWCIDIERTMPFDFSTPINQKTKLWAKWDEGQEKLKGVQFTTIGEAALSSLYSGDFMPLIKDYIWTTTPSGTTRYTNLKFTSSDTSVAEVKYLSLLGTYAVYAKKQGNAILTVSIDSDDEPAITYTDTANINVMPNSNRVKKVEFTDPQEETVNISKSKEETLQKQLQWKVTGERSGKVINDKVMFYSSDENVATVDENGLVTFLYKGTVVISVIAYNSYDGNIKYDQVTFVVNLKLDDFYFDKTELLMFYKDSERTDQPKSYQLNVTFVPEDASDKNLTWSTSNSTILTVNNGLLTAQNAPSNGEAKDVTITAHHSAIGDKTCAVHLVMPVETMSFNEASKTIDIGETCSQTVNLKTKSNKTPSLECRNVTWVSSNTNVATVDENGLVTAVSGGDAKITAINNYDKLTTKPQASYNVHVTQKIKKISLSTNYIFFAEGYKDSETVTLTIDPSTGTKDFTIDWSSNNTNIVTVTPSSDKLTAEVKPGNTAGETYISVTVTDKYSTTLTMQCAISNYDKTPTEDKLTFELVNETYTVSANSSWGHVVIPDKHSGINVTKVKNNGFEGMNITDIFIPHTITSIGSYSFASCNNLSTVLFSPKVTNNLTIIGEAAFKPNKLGKTFEYIGLEYCANLTTIGASAFENQIFLPSITIPSNVTTIGDNAFNNCQSLTTVIINSNTIAKLDNPGSLFTPLSTDKKIVKVPKNTSVGSVLSDTSKYTKSTSSTYDIYTQK